MRRDVESPKAYLADLDDKQGKIVKRIRKSIKQVAPRIEEKLQYGMLDYPGLANLAAQKRYVALYVAPEVLAKHKSEFPGVSAGKSCLRFTSLDQVDAPRIEALLADVLAFRSAGGSKRRA